MSKIIKRYIKLEHADRSNLDWFVVNWCLGNTCNFACSYCPTFLHDGSKKWPDLTDIKTFIKKVKLNNPSKKIYIEFTGGEVTLYKHFIDICKFCNELDVKVGLISNGSRTIRYWEENKNLFDHICLSFHPEFSKPDHFLKVVSLLSDNLRTHVNVMMSPDHFDMCKTLVEEVVKVKNISLALQPLIVDFKDQLYDYSQEQLEFINQQDKIIKQIVHDKTFKNYRGSMNRIYPDGNSKTASAHQFIAFGANDWKDWNCYAGVEQMIVDMDGSVYRGWCKVGGSIGKIWDTDLKFYSEPIICNKEFCHCNFDIMSTKEKI